ncbi:amidase signature domain-containing protein [Aspergillus germanicus]
MTEFTIPHSRPYGFTFPIAHTALLIIDMQRDFLDPAGFGSIQCGNPEIFTSVRKIVPVLQRVLHRSRDLGLQIIHTREGHRPDLLDLPAAKRLRQISAPDGHHDLAIGDRGPMGRLLVRGEYGHDVIDELKPRPGEVVIDKPGKGSFWGTSLHRELLARGVSHLLVAGVTTECCVTTTIRECNDRGFECCLLSDCTDGFDAQMVTTAMDTICAQDGLFGFVGDSSDFLEQTANYTPTDLALSEDVLPSISQLVRKYRDGTEDPVRNVNMLYDRIEKHKERNPTIWTSIQSRGAVLESTQALVAQYIEDKHNFPPLFGVPFAVQDSIDVAGIPTTAAWAGSYTPETTAPVVQVLVDAGAIFIGKLNVDPLAVDLVCSSSPPSGAAVAVGAGLVPFTMTTDTTGGSLNSGGLNGVVTLKTTKGTVSMQGIVPVCPSQDTISIVARSTEDTRAVWLQLQKTDNTNEPYAKPFASLPTWHIDARDPRPWKDKFRFAVPSAALLDAVCSTADQGLFNAAVKTLRGCGGTLVEIDYEPFQTASVLVAPNNENGASLLIHEHIATIGAEVLTENPSSLQPRLQKVYESHLSAPTTPWTIFQAQAHQADCVRKVQALFDPPNPDGIDILVVPAAPAYSTHKDLEAKDEIKNLSQQAGDFTCAVNVLDLCAVGINARSTLGPGAPPHPSLGVAIIGGMGYDAKVLDLARCFEATYETVRN